MKIPRGWREALSALAYALALGLVIASIVALLAGCAGTRLLAEYEHHSSIPNYRDWAETNQAGVVLSIPLRFKPEHCDRYCPELEIGAHWEWREPVFGRNPVGTVRVRQPIYVKE